MEQNDLQRLHELLDDDQLVNCLANPSPKSEAWLAAKAAGDPTLGQLITMLKEMMKHIRVEEPALEAPRKAELWARIEEGVRQARRRSLRRRIFAGVSSAAAIVAVALTLWLHDGTPFPGGAPDYALMVSSMDSSLTSGNVSLLMPGRRIEIMSDTAQLVYNREGEVKINTGKTEKGAEMNQLVVPYGKSSFLALSDGTKVWVNAGSKLIYPAVFEGDRREIYVEGEIFLDVSHSGKPFVVKTSNMSVRVMGTRFSVTAFGNESTQAVVLVSGAVRVDTGKGRNAYDMTPNQRFAYDLSSQALNVTAVDASDYISWIDGFLTFRSQPLGEALRQLQRYYNVEIDAPQAADAVRVSGKLDLRLGVGEALNFISLTAPVTCTKSGDRYVVTLKP